MNNTIRMLGMASLIGLTSGCASIMNGSTQSVSAMPMQGGRIVTDATCTIASKEGTWVSLGGMAAVVDRSSDDISVRCESDTAGTGIASASSSVQGAKIAANFFLIDLCIISCPIDFGTGAAFEYPSQVQVPMRLPNPPAPVTTGAKPPAADAEGETVSAL